MTNDGRRGERRRAVALLLSRARAARGRGMEAAKSDLPSKAAMRSLSGGWARRHGDAWRRRYCRRRSSDRASTVTVFKVFEPILTVQNSKFHIGTRNLIKIEVVEDKMIYNFAFGRKLIWGLDQ